MVKSRSGASAPACATLLFAVGTAFSMRTPSIEDAIQMTRVQVSSAVDGAVGAFSPDGSQFAAVVWRGDLRRNSNVYEVLLFRIEEGNVGSPAVVFSQDFSGDPSGANVSPIDDLQFLDDNRSLVFIGRDGAAPAQVFRLDTATRQITQLTRHPTAVRSYVASANGRLLMYSAVALEDEESDRAARLDADGVFLWDGNLFDQRTTVFKAFPVLKMQPRRVRQYFIVRQGEPELAFDSRQSRSSTPLNLRDPAVAGVPTLGLHEEIALSGWATLSGEPTGHYALLFPYGLADHVMRTERYRYYDSMNAYGRRVAAPYGLVDLTTGRIERLIDAPHPQFADRDGGANPLWARDGKSVIVYTLLPLAEAGESALAEQASPQWCEVDIGTRRVTPLGIPAGWRVLRWSAEGDALVLSKGNEFATLKRSDEHAWSKLKVLGAVSGFSSTTSATNGRLVIGVRESLSAAPELAAFDLRSKRVFVLTDLNAQLRQRDYALVEPFHWHHKFESNASGFLIRPARYMRGERYPLVVLLDDGALGAAGEPFILDAVLQLSGYAIQTLANSGFVVLYLREPPSLGKVMSTPQEGEYMREHVEAAIAAVDRMGLIQRDRIGISGWSRAGYHANYILIHSRTRFAAAAQIDGGGIEYLDGMRPFTDDELSCIRTPLLLEAHGTLSLVLLAAMADRLEATRTPTEILYFASAPHQTVRPQHRLRSLSTHLDWWRFWLKDETDAAAEKKYQYEHWRELRQLTKTSAQAAACAL